MQNKWDKTQDWFWEGNVQKRIVDHLCSQGYRIVSMADTLLKERGPDILAEKNDQRKYIEVKGYPSDKYVAGPKAGEKKPTNPTSQSQMWLSHAILDIARVKSRDPHIEITIGLPRVKRYISLLNELAWFRKQIMLFIMLVSEQGIVEAYKPDDIIK